MLNPATLADNAMLHKDVTQWLRNKTFAALFFGLLTLAEVIILIIVASPMDRGQGGPVAFGILTTVLAVYTLIIAISGYGLTAKEFQNRTFELYELSGMSLERMIRGKLLSLVAQFLFGFFCIAPFMFIAYLLGGLDFYTILGVMMLFAIVVPPLYLMSLVVSLHGFKTRSVSALIRVGAVLVLMFFFRIPFFFFMYGARGSSFGPIDLIKKLLELDSAAINFCLIFLAFYAQFCLLLFYLSCNAISPATDTREGQVKFFASSLAFSLLGMAFYSLSAVRSEAAAPWVIFAFIIFGIPAMLFFWGPVEPPMMARRRAEHARWITMRAFHYWFAPGARGTMRAVMLYWAVSVLMALAAGASAGGRFFLFMLPLALPFFVAFPACFLTRLKRLASRPVALRVVMLMWWGLGGGLLFIATMILRETYRNLYSTVGELLVLACAVASPVSALLTLDLRDNSTIDAMSTLWPVMGLVGLFLMRRSLAVRARALPTGANRVEKEKERGRENNGTEVAAEAIMVSAERKEK